MARARNGIPAVNRSVRRIFAITETLVSLTSPVSATELAARTGYPYTTVVADLKSLQGLGYVTFDPETRTYAPTLRFTLLAGSMSTRIRLTERLRAMVDGLAATTRETAILWQNIGSQMQIMYVALGQEPLRMVVEPGMTYDVERSASGRAWSMACRQLGRDQGLASARRQVGGSKAEEQEIQRALRRGYAVAYEELVPHVGSIAIPLVLPPESGTRGAELILVVSVGGVAPRIRAREREIAETLRKAVNDLRSTYLQVLRDETA